MGRTFCIHGSSLKSVQVGPSQSQRPSPTLSSWVVRNAKQVSYVVWEKLLEQAVDYTLVQLDSIATRLMRGIQFSANGPAHQASLPQVLQTLRQETKAALNVELVTTVRV